MRFYQTHLVSSGILTNHILGGISGLGRAVPACRCRMNLWLGICLSCMCVCVCVVGHEFVPVPLNVALKSVKNVKMKVVNL